MSEHQLVPHIRFQGFEDEWEEKRMSQVVHERNSKIIPSEDYPLMAFIARKGVTSKGEKYNRDFLVKSNKKKYKMTKYGDLIYSSNNLDVGSIGINKYGNAAISPVYSIFEISNKKSNFLGYLIQKSKFINDMLRYRQGVTYGQWRIHESDFLNLQALIPRSEEQQKIGNLFAKLDQLLDLQQQKLNQLDLLKKALLQNLFPAQGAKIPALRFQGFEDEWLKNKVGKIFKSISDKHHEDLKVLTASQKEGMILRDNMGIDIKYKRSSLGLYKRVMPGQFVIHLRSFQGGLAYSKYEGITSPAYTVLTFIKKENHNPLFWKSIFSSENFIRRLKTITYGVRDGKSISYSDFVFLLFSYPSVQEQQKIGNLFAKLDQLIELEQQKLAKIKQVKKALLQNMFVE